MLSENIKTIRKAKGLSQEELAVKLNVVRQTVSKWEQGLSVPDSELLVALSEALETPVSTLLGENVTQQKEDDLKVISQKLEVINHQLAENQQSRRKLIRVICIFMAVLTLLITIVLFVLNSPYLGWDYSDMQTAVLGVNLHAFEWIFVRLAPFVMFFAVLGIVLTSRREK